MAATQLDLSTQAMPGSASDSLISATAAISFSKLAPLPSGNILVGSAGNAAVAVAVSGDISLSNAGASSVLAVRGVAVSATAPSVGQFLTADSAAASSWKNPTVAGDLSGTLPNPTVAKIQGTAVVVTAPLTSQVLQFNGTAWAPATIATGGGTVTGTGAAGQVAYWTSATAESGDATLLWDTTNKVFSVGGAAITSAVSNIGISGSSVTGFVATTASATQNSFFAGARAGGTLAAPTAAPSGALLAEFQGIGHNGTIYDVSKPGGDLMFTTTELWSATAHGTSMSVYLIPNGSITKTLNVIYAVGTGTGRVGFGGNTNPLFTVDATGDANVSGLYRVGGAQIASANLSDAAALIKTTTTLGGDLTGTLPNPTIAASAITDSKVAAAANIAVTKLAKGTAAQYLRTNAANTAIEWGTFIYKEVPALGAVDGSNRYFQLLAQPVAGTDNVFKNGMLMDNPAPTTTAGVASLTFTAASATVSTASTADFVVGDVIRSVNADALGVIISLVANTSFTLAQPWDGATVTSVGTKLTTTGDYIIQGRDMAFVTAPSVNSKIRSNYAK